MDNIRFRTSASLWCGDLILGSCEEATDVNGNLEAATTPGTGCGVVLANASDTVIRRCEVLGRALVESSDGAPLPSGAPGNVALTVVAA